VVSVSKHYTAVIDGAIHDTISRRGRIGVGTGIGGLKDGWSAGLNRNAMLQWAGETAQEHVKRMEAYKPPEPSPVVLYANKNSRSQLSAGGGLEPEYNVSAFPFL
jgi:hypothetical protein